MTLVAVVRGGNAKKTNQAVILDAMKFHWLVVLVTKSFFTLRPLIKRSKLVAFGVETTSIIAHECLYAMWSITVRRVKLTNLGGTRRVKATMHSIVISIT